MRLTTKLYRMAVRLADHDPRSAELMIEAADRIKAAEDTPEKRRDRKFQREAIAYLKQR
jgi:hypothetical protein